MLIVLKSGSFNLLEPSEPLQVCNGIAFTIYLLTAIGFSPGGSKLYKHYLVTKHHKPPRVKHRYTRMNPEKKVLACTHSDMHVRTTGKARKQFPVNVQAVEKRSVIILVTRPPPMKSNLSQFVPATSSARLLSTPSY